MQARGDCKLNYTKTEKQQFSIQYKLLTLCYDIGTFKLFDIVFAYLSSMIATSLNIYKDIPGYTQNYVRENVQRIMSNFDQIIQLFFYSHKSWNFFMASKLFFHE